MASSPASKRIHRSHWATRRRRPLPHRWRNRAAHRRRKGKGKGTSKVSQTSLNPFTLVSTFSVFIPTMTRKTSTFQGNRTTSPAASITPISSPSSPDGRPTPTVNPSAPATTEQKPLAKEPESLSPSKMLDRDHLESTFDGEIVEKWTSRVVKPIVSRLDLLESTINSHVSVTFSDVSNIPSTLTSSSGLKRSLPGVWIVSNLLSTTSSPITKSSSRTAFLRSEV